MHREAIVRKWQRSFENGSNSPCAACPGKRSENSCWEWLGAKIFSCWGKWTRITENLHQVVSKKINQYADVVIFKYRIFLVLYQKFWYKPCFVSKVLIQNTCDAFCSAVDVQNKSFSHDSLKSGKRRLWTFQITKDLIKRLIRTKVMLIRVNCSLLEIQEPEWFYQDIMARSAAARLQLILLWQQA